MKFVFWLQAWAILGDIFLFQDRYWYQMVSVTITTHHLSTEIAEADTGACGGSSVSSVAPKIYDTIWLQ